MVTLLSGSLVSQSAEMPAWKWYVDCSERFKDSMSGGGQSQIEAQCDDLAEDGFSAPVRKTLQDATRWLTHSLGFLSPAADHIPIDDENNFVAIVYDNEYEDTCRGRKGCFILDDRRVYVADSYVRGADDVIVHELFHAIQLAYRGEAFFELPVSSSDAADPHNLMHLRGWITEGTAEAVAQAWVNHNGAGQVQGSGRRHDHPLHEPVAILDAYGTASFWLFLGAEIESEARIAYLEEMLQMSELSTGNGVSGVDEFLKPNGGLFALFPRFLAKLPVDGAFGEVAQWQVRLPAGHTQATGRFRGNVREIAGTAARLSVTHASEHPVAVEIRFRGDERDLHLIVDGEVRVLGPDGVRNVFTTQMQNRSQTFELVIAEVAEQAELSTDQDFEVEVEVRERGCYWAADASGIVTASMGGEAMATSFTKAGAATSNTINFHHPSAVDAFRLVPDPDTPLALILGFPDDLDSGSFDVNHSVLWGRSFQLSQMGTGTMQLTVLRNAQFEPPAATVQQGAYDAFGTWVDAGVTRVNGEFAVKFDRIQSWMTALEREGPVIVNGRFAWTPECANALDRRQQAGQPKREPAITRELREGLLAEGIRRMYPTPPPLPNQ